MSIEMSTIVKQSKGQVSCNLNDEVAILNPKNPLYFGLDEVGAHILQAISEPPAVSEICKMVLDRFEVDEVHCCADVLQFLTELEQAALLEVVASDVPTGI